MSSPPTPCSGIKIKDNGIDKRIGGVVVYKRYMRHPQSALDMPLDLIFNLEHGPNHHNFYISDYWSHGIHMPHHLRNIY